MNQRQKVQFDSESQLNHSLIPEEFGYWDNIDKTSVKAIRTLAKLVLGFDPVLPDERVREFAYSYYDTDPVAEAVVADVFDVLGMGRAMALLQQALEQGIDSLDNPPASLVRMFKEIETEPEWLDKEKSARGAKVWRRYGRVMFYYIGSMTLEGYRESSVAKPLAFTGAYDGSSAGRRFVESSNFWFEAAQPGALEAGGQGRKTAVRVRIMHVLVRARLLKHPDWDAKAWGLPISQADSLVTVAAGNMGAGVGLQRYGFRFSKSDIEALLHFWRHVAWLMGVQPRWYPETFQEGVQFAFTVLVKGVKRSGEDGVSLARSYVKSFAPNADDPLPRRILDYFGYQFLTGFTRSIISRASYNHFGLPQNGLWRYVPLTLAPAVFALETIRKHIQPLDQFLDEKVQENSRRWLDRHLGKEGAAYKPVEQFTR